METDERDAINTSKRVKEMSEKREDPFFFSNDLFLHRLCFKLKLSYWFKIHQIRFFIFFHIFHIFLYFSF
jgi:hypothetical protein